MNRFLQLLIFTLIFCNSGYMKSQDFYQKQWEEIDKLSNSGQYKSLLPKVLELQKQAVKEENALEIIKSLKAEFSILKNTNNDEKNNETSVFFGKILSLEKNTSGNYRWVFEVLKHEFIADYYEQNSWKINNRTNINSQDLTKIETWSELDFKLYLQKNYAELYRNKASLKNVKLMPYRSIFDKAEHLEYFPSLLEYFGENYINFLKSNKLFTPLERKENQTQITTIENDLIAENTGNAKLYFQLQKIKNDCAIGSCKNKIEQLTSLYKSPTEGDYKVYIAKEIVILLMSKEQFTEAMSWIAKAEKDHPKSPFLIELRFYKNQIVQPNLVVKYEKTTLANRPIQMVATYTNLDRFQLKIYSVKGNEAVYLKYIQNAWQNDIFKTLKKSLVKTQTFNLLPTQDYKKKSTALDVGVLPSGLYVAEYEVEGKSIDNFYFIVTNTAVIFQQISYSPNVQNTWKLVDNYDGKPFANTPISLFQLDDKELKQTDLITKTDGSFSAANSVKYNATCLVKNKLTDDYSLVKFEQQVKVHHNFDNPDQKKIQMFLDRAIYRPGQTLYFKGIATQLLNKKESVENNRKVVLKLLDSNGQEVDSQNFTTNSFGSFQGNFVLPKNKVNGIFSLRIDNESLVYFRVEEFKRPNFEVEFSNIKEEYQYGKTIELKGKAVSFSGIPIANATVNYEIIKRNIRWKYFNWYHENTDNDNSILGSTKTNEKGEFTVALDLKKDENLEGIQVDNYKIKASVADINGESQSTEKSILVSSVSHHLSLSDVKFNYFSDENISVKVEAKNYNNQIIKNPFTVKLSKLISPKKLYRSNFENEIQNDPMMSETDFNLKFPHDYFSNEEKKDKVEKVIFDQKMQPVEGGIYQIMDKLEVGNYKLEVYNVEGKDTIITSQKFEVFDKKSLSSKLPFLKVVEEKNEYNRNDKAKFYIYSGVKDALVHIYTQNGDGNTKYETVKLNNGYYLYETKLPNDESISDLDFQFQLVALGDVQTQTKNIKIKSEKKGLNIETITFRDKLEPGQKEKWTIKITGDKNEKVNAEVLANMYDQSLDQFASNDFVWNPLYEKIQRYINYFRNSKQDIDRFSYYKRIPYIKFVEIYQPQFRWMDDYIYARKKYKSENRVYSESSPAPSVDMMIRGTSNFGSTAATEVVMGYSKTATKLKNLNADLSGVKLRENLSETAFFYPNLLTDKDGNVSFEFTSPEALTRWKLMFLAHTKNAEAATLEKTVVTQKEFSVTPNYPRFLREGDELIFKTKLNNLSKENLSGTVQLQILDAFSNEDISSKFNLNDIQKSFTVKAGESTMASWTLKVPNGAEAIVIKTVAKTGNFSDGEQKAVPILPNRIMVTDAVPVFVKEGQTKSFVLENLAQNKSTTATNISNSLELTTNPIWEVIFALPGLKNDNNTSADVVFNKWFADVLAAEIFRTNPKLKSVFEDYQSKGLLGSNLSKNQELKQLLLEETPWVLDAKNEEGQMQKIARLFDANTMRNSINQDWDELKKLQNTDGGFSWMAGYPSSYSSSLYILKQLGKLNSWLKNTPNEYQSTEQNEMVGRLIRFVDQELNRYFEVNKGNAWSNFALDYLDTRNYWESQYPLSGNGKFLKNLVVQKAKKAEIEDFSFFGLHRAALLFNDYGLKELSKKLMTYLKETSVESDNQGAYWKSNIDNWGWYNSQLVNHAGALEAFEKLGNDQKFVEEMKIWLITQKEVSHWDTSRSTAEVIFTILNSGKSWTADASDKAEILWGGKEMHPQTKGSGYLKQSVYSEKMDESLATVSIKKDSPGIVQGGLFWQYYEDLNQVKSTENYISLTKELYKKVKTVNGEELQKITENAPLKIGDKITVRMILNADRPMEFVLLKDMRAAGLEPVDVLSAYQWKNNLAYYQVTKDASTQFFIEYLPKGQFVFEYDLVANVSGVFSNGITTLQNYYAPQMNSRTQGTKLIIE